MKYYSNAQWPADEDLCVSPYGDNISTDQHHSWDAADAVCNGLMREGLGGQGEIFPVKVWTTTIPEEGEILPCKNSMNGKHQWMERVGKNEHKPMKCVQCRQSLIDMESQAQKMRDSQR